MPRSSYVRRRAAVASAAIAGAKAAAAKADAQVDEFEVMKIGFQLRLDMLPAGVEIRQGERSYIVTESFLQAKIPSLTCSLCEAETTLQTSDHSQFTGSFEVTCTDCDNDNVANTSKPAMLTDLEGIVTNLEQVKVRMVYNTLVNGLGFAGSDMTCFNLGIAPLTKTGIADVDATPG